MGRAPSPTVSATRGRPGGLAPLVRAARVALLGPGGASPAGSRMGSALVRRPPQDVPRLFLDGPIHHRSTH